MGTQKAATTSVAAALRDCNLVSFGIPLPSTGVSRTCKSIGGGFYHECKETLHVPISLLDEEHRDAFRRMHDVASCDHVQPAGNEAACRNGYFLSATPLSAHCRDKECTEDGYRTPSVESFLWFMPRAVLSHARFAVIFREPVSSLLSLYNHMLHFQDNGVIFEKPPSSFQAFWHRTCFNCTGFNRRQEYRYRDWASSYMAPWYASSAVSRSQLLVLNFDYLVGQTADAMRLLTQHYGLPRILTSMSKLPESNTNDGPEKVVKIKCSTRSEAGAAYHDANHRLYGQLRDDRASAQAPDYEPEFSTFDLESVVGCSNREVTMGDLTPTELSEHLQRRRRGLR